MSMFQRSLYGDEPGFTNLFRMLDAFENYNSQSQSRTNRATPSFTPKFDVSETETTFELSGELPGIDRKDVHIDFTEPQTIVVSGRVERSFTSGTPPAGLVEGGSKPAAITEGSEPSSHSHKATVSDEETEAAKESGEEKAVAGAVSPSNSNNKKAKPQHRFWHQERSVGQFSRTFTFPVPIDEANTRANLKDGVLHVSVPKASKRSNRRINID